MKRDMELIRKILLKFEERDQLVVRKIKGIQPDGYEDGVVIDHIKLMMDDGLVVRDVALFKKDSKQQIDARARSLGTIRPSATGYNYLDSIRDPEIWRKTKAVAQTSGNGTVEFLWSIAREIAKAEVKRFTGLNV